MPPRCEEPGRGAGGADGDGRSITERLGELDERTGQIDLRLAHLRRVTASTFREMISLIAGELREQHICSSVVAPLTYGQTAFSSPFGRQASVELEADLATGPECVQSVVHGSYIEDSKELRIVVVAVDPKTGRARASGESRVPIKVLPNSLPRVPQNLQQALRDQHVLAPGEEVAGELRVELWTQKGTRGLVFTEDEPVRIYLRVNRPAYVRITYLLASGERSCSTKPIT